MATAEKGWAVPATWIPVCSADRTHSAEYADVLIYELHMHDASGKSGIQAAVLRSRSAFGPIAVGDRVVGAHPLSQGLEYTVARIRHSFPLVLASWELDLQGTDAPVDDWPIEDPEAYRLVHRIDVFLTP